MGIKKTNEQFLKEVEKLVKDDYSFLEHYKGSSTKISVRHNTCNYIYSVTPSNFISNGKRCAMCAGNLKYTIESLREKIFKLVGDEYTLLSEVYKNSQTKVQIKHVNCGYIWDIIPNAFIQGNRCPKCAGHIKYTIKTLRDKIFELVGNEYTVLSEEYKNNRDHIQMKHISCGHIYLVTSDNFINKGTRCPNCYRSIPYTIQSIKDKIFQLVRYEYDVLSKDYKNMHTPIQIKHSVCGHIFLVTPNSFIRNNSSCPNCSGHVAYTIERVREKVHSLVGDEYIVLSDECFSSEAYIKIKHMICNKTYLVKSNNFINNGRRCPICKSSKGEQKIYQWLSNNNITFQTQYEFEGLTGVNNGNLRFDFAIMDDNKKLDCLIEFDGEFHYKKIYDNDGHETLQIHDRQKNIFCLENNIKLLRIPYWEFENIENILESYLSK